MNDRAEQGGEGPGLGLLKRLGGGDHNQPGAARRPFPFHPGQHGGGDLVAAAAGVAGVQQQQQPLHRGAEQHLVGQAQSRQRVGDVVGVGVRGQQHMPAATVLQEFAVSGDIDDQVILGPDVMAAQGPQMLGELGLGGIQTQVGDVGVAEGAGEQVDHLLPGGGEAGPVPLGGLGVVGDRGGHQQPPPLGRAAGAGHRRPAAIAAPVRGSVR